MEEEDDDGNDDLTKDEEEEELIKEADNGNILVTVDSNRSSLQVTRQMLLYFSIGKHYVDEELCDIILMDACHVLLERPLQFDKSV